MFVLEPESSCREGYSFIAGYSFANDDRELCDGLSRCIRDAIADAGLIRDQIDAINAWGPGHTRIDAAESTALRNVFNSQLNSIPAVSIKGSIGNPLGAAPAIQVCAATLAQKFGILPPTVNWKYSDPACPLNLSAQSRTVAHRTTLINAHGLSGVNSCLVLQKC